MLYCRGMPQRTVTSLRGCWPWRSPGLRMWPCQASERVLRAGLPWMAGSPAHRSSCTSW